MNKVELLGRLTKNPEIRYAEGENPVAVGRYTLAVNRRWKWSWRSSTLQAVKTRIKSLGENQRRMGFIP